MTQWQPPASAHLAEAAQPEPIRISTDNRPPGPATYGRSTSNDYTVYEHAGTPTPANANDPYAHHNAMTYRGDDAYFQRPYRRAGTASIRDTTETGSMRAGRYTPLASGHTPKAKSVSIPPNPEAYPDDSTEDHTPQRPPPRPAQRRGTSIYIVREGGDWDGGDGTPPPDGWYQLPFNSWLKGPIRNHFFAVLGEFVGTTLFLYFASPEHWWPTSVRKRAPIRRPTRRLDTAQWSIYPAVTLGMVMTRTINYVRGFLLVAAQLCGAIFASFLVQVMFPYEFNVRTTLSDSTSVTRGVFIEAVFTAELVFTVFMLAKEKHKATYMAPVGIGLALFIAELVGVFFTGGSLNPARSFGPCVTTGQFDPEHWIYWVGPALGAIAAVAFYRFIKILEYQMANPGQDHSAEEAEAASLRAAKRNSHLGGGEREKESV